MAYKGSHANGDAECSRYPDEHNVSKIFANGNRGIAQYAVAPWDATGRTMTAGVNLYSDTRRTPQNATGAVKQEETKE